LIKDDSTGNDGGTLAVYLGEYQRGRIVAPELQRAADLLRIVLDAALLDFESADAASAEVLRHAPQIERQDLVDRKTRHRRVGDRLRASEVRDLRRNG
jgi:hypothetical protein